jgi:hypothetical protein
VELTVSSASFVLLFVFELCVKIGLVRAAVRFVIYVCIGYFIIGIVLGLFGIRGL